MAVDLSLLPLETPFEETPPSWVTWAIAFVLMVCVGVAAVMLLWPRGGTTQSWKFWASLILFPVSLPCFIVLRRYHTYEARKLDASLHNEAVRSFNERVFHAASIPLAVGGAAYRYSADDKENAVQAIRQGTVMLETQKPIISDADPVRARWLTVPDIQTTLGNVSQDLARSRSVTTWLCNELLGELAPRIQALKSGVPLAVQLLVTNGLSFDENRRLWQERWSDKSLRPMVVAPPAEAPTDVMMLDRWLDTVLEGRDQHAILFVAIQLHPLLSAAPPKGTAEAGAAVLLLPDSLAHQHEMQCDTNLHRPVRGLLNRADVPLSTAIRWAGVSAERIKGAWQTSLDAAQSGAVRESAIQIGLTALATDLDQTVGHAGVAAPWLALACASATLAEDPTEHIVLIGQGEYVDCAILKRRNAAQSKANTIAAQEVS